MSFDGVLRVADAILFEGYALYPYRASAPKNHLRWQFGVLMPRAFFESCGSEAWWMESQCLVEADGGFAFDAKLRFLHVRRRSVEALRGGAFEPVESLDLDGRLHVSWDEAFVREIDAATIRAEALPLVVPFEIPATTETEILTTAGGACGGRVTRSREALRGAILLSQESAGERLTRLRVRVENLTPCAPAFLARADATGRALLSAHLLLAVRGGAFVSLLDPPAWASEAAAACASVRTYPVLAGDPGCRDTVLSAPIILYDHPQIAPESPGDLFDATEIDEILTLRTMLLTDEVKREVRATDERAAAILDRIDGLTPEQLGRLHGVIREASTPSDDSAPPGSLRIGSALVRPGARVRILRSLRRTDAQDMFLAGLTATVARIERDIDGRDCLAVTVDADPAAELLRWHGRYHYFYPDEVEALDPDAGARSEP